MQGYSRDDVSLPGGVAEDSAATPSYDVVPLSEGGKAKLRNSLPVFRKYLGRAAAENAEGYFAASRSEVMDASPIIGRACYEDWLRVRGYVEPSPETEKTFQRTLTAHLTGSDGRQPFTPEEESAILLVIRQKRPWPAFEGTGSTIGCKGFRSVGFHEKRRSGVPAIAPSPPQPPPKTSSKRLKRNEPAAPLQDNRAHPLEEIFGEIADMLSEQDTGSVKSSAGVTEDHETLVLDTTATTGKASPVSPLPTRCSPLDPQDDCGEIFFEGLQWLITDQDHETRSLRSPVPFQSLLARANEALASYGDSTKAILMVNLYADDFDSLFVAQNSQSIPLIGLVTATNGGQFRPLIAQTELVILFRHVLHAIRHPGAPSASFTLPVALASGETTPLNVELQSLGAGLVMFSTNSRT